MAGKKDRIVFRPTAVVKETDITDIDLSDNEYTQGSYAFSYIIFALSEVRVKYRLKFDDILLLLYLFSLKQFKKSVDIVGVHYPLNSLIKENYVKKNNNVVNDKYYVLTRKGIEVVNTFVSSLKNRSKYYDDNTVLDKDFKSALELILSII